MRHRRLAAVVIGGAVVALSACGRKGPPLAPLRPVPGPVTGLTARRIGNRVELHFIIPTINADRTSPASISRVEVYARSAPAGSPRPVAEQIVLKDNLVDTIEVKPPVTDKNPPKNPPPANAPADPRPATGDAVSFAETLPTAAPTALPALKKPLPKVPVVPAAAPGAAPATGAPGQGVIPSISPESRATGSTAATAGATTAPPTTPPATPPTTAPTTPPATAAAGAATPANPAAAAAALEAAKAAAKPAPPTRYFWIQAVSSHGKPGTAAELVAVPLTDLPKAPTKPVITFDEKNLTVSWTPAADGQTFRVYDVDKDGKEKNKDGRPLNDTPLKTASFQVPVEFGHERCFAVRTADVSGATALESDAVVACETPKDIFPPAAPGNLNGLPDNGTVALRWDPVTAPDLAGYLVLRGEGTGGTLQPLMTTPITAATYVDATVRPGVTYVYVVVAVDATANRSDRSNSYTVTIR